MNLSTSFRIFFLCGLLTAYSLFPLAALAQIDPLSIDLSEVEISVPDSVRLLMDEIAEAEAAEDSFDPRLGELSFDLGQQLVTLELNHQALEAFQRSDQSMKIREGLYSENREIPVRKIYEQHLALNNWDDAAISLNTIAWIKARNYDSNSLEYVAVLQELIRWSLAEDAQEPDGDKAIYLSAAYDDLTKIYDIYEQNDQPLDKDSLDLVVAINHRLALHGVITPNLEALKTRQNRRHINVSERACQGQYSDNEELLDNCIDAAKRQVYVNTPKASYGVAENQTLANTQQLSVKQEFFSSQHWSVTEIDNSVEVDYDPMLAFFSQSYSRGKETLLDQLDVLRTGEDDEATLNALLALGDWYLLFGYFQSAKEVYATSWSFAEERGMGEQVNMQPPVAISIAALAESLPRLRSGSRDGFAKISLGVASTGEVESVEILETDIEDEKAVAELVAEFSMSRYRPVLREGVPFAAIKFVVDRQITY